MFIKHTLVLRHKDSQARDTDTLGEKRSLGAQRSPVPPTILLIRPPSLESGFGASFSRDFPTRVRRSLLLGLNATGGVTTRRLSPTGFGG